MSKNKIHIQIHLCLCMLIAFLLPVYIQITPLIIILLAVNQIASGGFREKWLQLKNNKTVWLPILLYLLHVAGMMWTENTSFGLFDLEVKLSLILFPLILASASSENNKANYKSILWAFVPGCVVSGIICFGVAGLHYFKTGENHFAYTLFSYNMHPSYLAMYMVFGIAIVLFVNPLHTKYTRTINTILLLFLFLTIVVLASKSGIITSFLLLLFYLIYLSLIKKKATLALSLLGAFMLLTATVFCLSPYTKQRIEVAINTIRNADQVNADVKESNAERILIWKSGIQTICRNLPLGSGTGDIKDELMRTYALNNYKDLFQKNLNAHNQFFQTAIALGMAGMLLIISCFIFPLFSAFKHKNILLISFLLITAVNFSVESMLEVQAGTIFFSFFYALLLKNNSSTA